jgi:hypothetical protein
MKGILSLLLAAAAMAAVAPGATAVAADGHTLWAATNDPARFQIVDHGMRNGKRIWLATDINQGGREELEETGRNDAGILLKSLRYQGATAVLTDTEYRAYRYGRLGFQRTGRWVH